MRRPLARLVALVLAGVALVQGAATVVLVTVPPLPGVPSSGVSPAQVLLDGAFLFVTPIVGGIVASLRPRHPAGWLFLAIDGILGLSFFGDEFVRHVRPSLALGYFATLASSLGTLAFAALFVLFLTFPNGRLPAGRARLLLVPIALGTAAQVVSGLFAPGPQQAPAVPGLEQPLAQPGWQAALELADASAQLCFLVAFVGVVALLAVRFRRARAVERQQLKWFASAAALFAALITLALVTAVLIPPLSDAFWIAAVCTLPLLPVAAAIAILRHQLFDIDLVIRRTVVYAGLSLVLAVAYGASVLLLRQLLSPLAPSGSLAVAGSTLFVAALFQPVRGRVQDLVDRRFYRGRYDAARETAHFAAGLREEVDVGRVEVLLAAAVERTVQPAAASIWLREAAE